MNKEMKFSKSLAHGIILAVRERRRRVSRLVFSLSLPLRALAEASSATSQSEVS